MRQQIEDNKDQQRDQTKLSSSINEIKKRCLKHQKSEIEVKKQLNTHKYLVVRFDLERMTDRSHST
jgi:hypothetical protein